MRFIHLRQHLAHLCQESTHQRVVALLSCAALSILSITLALWLVWPRMTGVTSRGDTLSYLPWRTSQVGIQQITVSLPLHVWSTGTWRVVPDDELLSLVVNGSPVSLDAIDAGQRRDWRVGFEIDLSSQLHTGLNTLTFVIRNDGGDGGVLLQPVLGLRKLILFAGFLPFLITLGTFFRLQRLQWLVLLVALALITQYWSITPWTVRSHDVLGDDGHLAYVQRIVDTHTLPKPTESWELFQAPLYYLGGALAWSWADLVSVPIPIALQAYSLCLWLVFLCASAAALKHGLRFNRQLAAMATAGIALWPSGIIHSIRIGNDLGLYATAALAMFYLLRWWRGAAPRHLLMAATFTALGLVTKSNALVLAATIALLIMIRIKRQWCRPLTPLITNALQALVMMGVGAALYLGRNWLYYSRGLIPDWVAGSSAQHLGVWLKVPNDLWHFVMLDVRAFLTTPWAQLTDDASGRGFFWNLLLRTSIFGEFSFDGKVQRITAYLFGGLVLAMLAALVTLVTPSVFVGFRSGMKDAARRYYRNLPWLIVSGLWIASVMSYRHRVPFACNNDFRYIVPILVPMMLGLSCIRAGRALIGIQCLLTILFFATVPYD